MGRLNRWLHHWLKTSSFIILSTLLAYYTLNDHFLWTDQIGAAIPTHPLAIFLHNLPFLFLFAVPVIGMPYAYLSFFFTAFIIAISIRAQGLSFTFARLTHLPLELLAFSGVFKPSTLKRFIVCIGLLYLAACFEIWGGLYS